MTFSFEFTPAAPPAAAPATLPADTAAFSALATVTKAMAEIKTEILNAFFILQLSLNANGPSFQTVSGTLRERE